MANSWILKENRRRPPIIRTFQQLNFLNRFQPFLALFYFCLLFGYVRILNLIYIIVLLLLFLFQVCLLFREAFGNFPCDRSFWLLIKKLLKKYHRIMINKLENLLDFLAVIIHLKFFDWVHLVPFLLLSLVFRLWTVCGLLKIRGLSYVTLFEPISKAICLFNLSSPSPLFVETLCSFHLFRLKASFFLSRLSSCKFILGHCLFL